MPGATDLNVPALANALQATATHLATAAQFQAGWRAARLSRWGATAGGAGPQWCGVRAADRAWAAILDLD